MRFLTRYSLRSLFIAIALVACGCAWVKYPEATARRFVAAPETFAARGLVIDDDRKVDVDSFAADVESVAGGALQAQPRTWWDCAIGRQTFNCGWYHFTVERGTITKGPRYILLCF